MPKAIVIERTGAPEVLHWQDVPMPKVGHKELLIRQIAVGLNYIDTYYRSGDIPLALPNVIGLEGAGIVEAVGEGCEYGFTVGMRVCYGGGPVGAYSQYRTLPERWAIAITEEISTELAAGIMVKGLTSFMLVKRVFMVDEHATVLVHAAAGGVGLMVCQWAAALGAKVIGVVSSEEKARLAQENGAEHVIQLQKESMVERVKEITQGQGCNVVYDSVGAATFGKSLACLNPIGLMVSYGEASGKVSPLNLSALQKAGSLFVTRPSFDHYFRNYHDYVFGAASVMEMISSGKMKANIGQTYYLRDAAKAHTDLEARKTKGATILYTESSDA